MQASPTWPTASSISPTGASSTCASTPCAARPPSCPGSPMRLRTLDIKALRDLWRMRAQALAIVLVTAAGTTAFITLLGTLSSVEKTQAAYYERYRFADLFANVRSAPDSRAADIARIPGVRKVTTRIVHNVVLDVAGMDEPINSLLVSAPQPGESPLNDI